MTKKELIYSMASEADLSSADAEKALNAFLKVVKKSLAKGESVSIMGFGSFFVSDMSGRKSVIAGRRRKRDIPASRVPRFKVSDKLCEAIKK